MEIHKKSEVKILKFSDGLIYIHYVIANNICNFIIQRKHCYTTTGRFDSNIFDVLS